MTLIRFKNQTEHAFLAWIGSFPESFHPTDMDRFYRFVKTLARYRAKQWRHSEYFKQRILEQQPNFKEANIDKFWDIMQHCLRSHKTPYLDSYVDSNGYGYKQVGVKDGEIYQIDITSEEFDKGGRKI